MIFISTRQVFSRLLRNFKEIHLFAFKKINAFLFFFSKSLWVIREIAFHQ